MTCLKFGHAVLAVLLVLATPAFTQQQQQQQQDPATLQRLLASTQAQRNQFLDALTTASVRVEMLTDDLARVQARIRELEATMPQK